MTEPEITVVADRDAGAALAADHIARVLAETVAARGRADWATTGGSTPVWIYRHLIEPASGDDRAVGVGPRLVGRRPVRAARPSLLERQGLRRHHARHRVDRGGHRRRPHPGGPDRGGRTSTRSGRARRSARVVARPGARTRWPPSCAARRWTWSTAGRCSTWCSSASDRTGTCCRSSRTRPPSTRRLSRWRSRPRPTSTRAVERVTLNPAVVTSARDTLVVVYRRRQGRGDRPDLRTGS